MFCGPPFPCSYFSSCASLPQVFAPLRGSVAEETEDPDAVAEQIRGSPDFACPLSRRLKDVVFVKELRDAMASGEFAVSLSGAQQLALIDYQNLCNKLQNFACKLEQDEIETDVLSPLERAKNLAQLSKICEQLEEYILKLAGTDWQSKQVLALPPPPLASTNRHPGTVFKVRDDQTVDLDGAFSDPGKAARFSRDLWERLSPGRQASSGVRLNERSQAEPVKSPNCKETQERAQEAVAARKRFLAKAADRLGPTRAKEGEAAPGADELRELRSELRGYEEEVRTRRSEVSVRNIEWLLQRCADELERDLLGTNMSEWAVAGPQLKLLVAEFSLLEKQVTSYQTASPEHVEELSVLEGDVTELAERLGLKGEEREARDFLSSSRRLLAQARRAFDRARSGLEDFYLTGGQLLWQDLQYASSLLGKAFFSNYTLRALEVRTLQRTVKDVLTLIPFLIILIIPLSPVGHVLVFSFIQKNFPEFFPSAFTEHRQNAIKIYRDIVQLGRKVYEGFPAY
ncbi:unnamed protein product [Symbiodinium natans]|uniref:Letm1 RBD domain-containing protein n=1 Tax=Symbiodinium natans TaxID=878477 RepID=A0A812TR54_9DINO|nr:unnamed protein product [Symbiodinium natans]